MHESSKTCEDSLSSVLSHTLQHAKLFWLNLTGLPRSSSRSPELHLIAATAEACASSRRIAFASTLGLRHVLHVSAGSVGYFDRGTPKSAGRSAGAPSTRARRKKRE